MTENYDRLRLSINRTKFEKIIIMMDRKNRVIELPIDETFEVEMDIPLQLVKNEE